jgi:hypothetical protein
LPLLRKDADESTAIAVHQISTGYAKQRINMRSATSDIGDERRLGAVSDHSRQPVSKNVVHIDGHGPLCRRHHRCKQAEGWHLEQPEPGVLAWHLPHGRSYTTTPEPYPV